jgi:hypothetical protein
VPCLLTCRLERQRWSCPSVLRRGLQLLRETPSFNPKWSEEFAGLCSRQQCRSGASSPEEENATRGPVQGNEAKALLRKAIRQGHEGEIGGDPSQAQAGAQASGAGRTNPSAIKEKANRREQASGWLAGRASPHRHATIGANTDAHRYVWASGRESRSFSLGEIVASRRKTSWRAEPIECACVEGNHYLAALMIMSLSLDASL